MQNPRRQNDAKRYLWPSGLSIVSEQPIHAGVQQLHGWDRGAPIPFILRGAAPTPPARFTESALTSLLRASSLAALPPTLSYTLMAAAIYHRQSPFLLLSITTWLALLFVCLLADPGIPLSLFRGGGCIAGGLITRPGRVNFHFLFIIHWGRHYSPGKLLQFNSAFLFCWNIDFRDVVALRWSSPVSTVSFHSPMSQ